MDNSIDVKLMFEIIGAKEYEKTVMAMENQKLSEENQKLKEENTKLSTVEEKPGV